MYLDQISVFIENIQGSLAEFTTFLGDEGINMQAFAVFDTPEFGVLRMIVDQPEKALEILRSEGYIASSQKILGAALQNTPGNLACVLRALRDADLTIDYLYTILYNPDGEPMLLFNTDDNERAEQVLEALR